MSSAILQDHPSVDSFFNIAETEALALFEYLSFEFLEGVDVFALAETGRTRDHEPPELMPGFLHCTTRISTAFARLSGSFGARLSG